MNTSKKEEKELNPQQIKFLEHYLDINSETFGNACQSALKAGYSKEYSLNMIAKGLKWLSEKVSDTEMLLKAEKNLKEFLNEKEDKKIKADITKFVASRLGKKRWSEKREVEHSGEVGIKALEESIKKISNEDKQKQTIGSETIQDRVREAIDTN